jgi:hypothetical protein
MFFRDYQITFSQVFYLLLTDERVSADASILMRGAAQSYPRSLYFPRIKLFLVFGRDLFFMSRIRCVLFSFFYLFRHFFLWLSRSRPFN